MVKPFISRLNPVLLPSGNHRDFQPEFVFSSLPHFGLLRGMDSSWNLETPLGRLHNSSLDIRIQDSGEAGYDYFGSDGLAIYFNRPEPQIGARESNESFRHLELEPLPRGGLLLHDSKARQRIAFRRFPGRIWYPVSVTDIASGLSIVMDRSEEGLLRTLSHPGGLRLEFINRADGLREGYDLVSPEGNRLPVMRYSYDAERRLTRADAAFSASWAYAYGPGVIESADDGQTRTRHIFDSHGRVVRVESAGGYKAGSITYHDDRRQITLTHGDQDGGVFEKLWFDEMGQHIMTANALGELSYRRFNDAHQLVSETDPNGNKTAWRYDSYGNIVSSLDGEGREFFRVYDDQGNLVSQKDPLGQRWRYGYDDAGRMISITSPLGHVTDMLLNDQGQPLRIMRHDGLMELRSYDARHRLISVTDFNSAITRFDYDDFNRLIAITDAKGNTSRLAYDPIKGKDFNTPSRYIRPDGVAGIHDFHPTGALRSVTDGEGRTTRYRIGAYDRLEEITDPMGHSLRFRFDSRENLIAVTNQIGLDWLFDRDAAGRVIREQDFGGRVTHYRYDGGGRLVRADQPDGSIIEYDYDRSNRLTELRATPAGGEETAITRFGYDANGALITADNDAARIALERDALGQVMAETVNDHRVESHFDCCGRRIRREMGEETGSKALTIGYDGMGNMTSWQLGEKIAPVTLRYDAVGLEVERRSTEGFRLEQDWDAMGQLLRQHRSFIDRRYGWTRAWEAEKIEDRHWGEKQYKRNANGQVTGTRHGDGLVETFAYGPDLNLRGTGTVSGFTPWATTPDGMVQTAAGTMVHEQVHLAHDAKGRVIRRRVQRAGQAAKDWHFTWDALDQLVAAECPDGRSWRYRYDAFGRRISRETPGERSLFHWDGNNLAMEIVNQRGVISENAWYYEPDSARPLAHKNGRQLYWLVNDHIGTPIEMVTREGHVLNTSSYETWGRQRMIGTGSGNTGINEEELGSFQRLRFQGQILDNELGIYYNRFRYYDPIAAQYMSPDPIRIAGGPRLHSYAAEPVMTIDPFGLFNADQFRLNGGTLCILNKFTPGSFDAQDFDGFMELWDEAAVKNGGFTRQPAVDRNNKAYRDWDKAIRKCCGHLFKKGDVIGHLPDVSMGGVATPGSDGWVALSGTVNSYLNPGRLIPHGTKYNRVKSVTNLANC